MTTNILTAIVTAYCACTNCCGPNAKGITADGHKAKQGITIAAPRSLPFGAKITIDGHTYTVQDRLAVRYDNRYDIYFRSHKKAKAFGIKTNQTIKIITKQ